MNDQPSLWERIQSAGRATGLSGGIRSYLRELREDMPDIEDRINDIGTSHMADDAAARAEFISCAQDVIQKVGAEAGSIEQRDLRTADRLVSALLREAGQLAEVAGQLTKTDLEAMERRWKVEFNLRLALEHAEDRRRRDSRDIDR